MGLCGPKKDEVGQAARWLLERQQELLMARTGAWGQVNVGARGHPYLASGDQTCTKNRHVSSLCSPLCFVAVLDYSITFLVSCHPWCSFAHMVFSDKSWPKPQLQL